MENQAEHGMENYSYIVEQLYAMNTADKTHYRFY